VTIPANAPVGAVTLEIANGLSTGTIMKNFTVAGPPVIQRIDFDPRGAGANSCVFGAGFGATQGSSTVAVNGAQVTAINWSDGQVCYTIPSSTGVGAATVQVTTPAGASNAFSFTVIGPPTISSITPSAAAPGAEVTIAGANFGPNQGSVHMWVGNSPNFSNILYLSVVSWSDTQVVVTIPANAPVGAVTLEIANGLSTGTAAKNFAVSGFQPGTLNTSRYLHSATLLSTGNVLIAGGVNCPTAGNCSYLSSAEIYDPNNNTFKQTGNMAATRSAPAVLLPNGKVLVAGGYSCDSNGNCTSLSNAEIYDAASGVFSSASNMTVDRAGHTMTLLNTGKVLIAGGESCISASSCTALKSAEIYDPLSGTFTAAGGTLQFARFGAAATILNNGNVLIAGGYDGSGFPAAGEIYVTQFDFFTSTAGGLGTPRYQPSSTLLNNGRVLIAGGTTCATPACPINTAELYDDTIGRFISTPGNMNVAVFNHTATLLNNGQVLIAGGYSSCTIACMSESGTQLYDPVAGTFSLGQPLGSSRAGHTSTLLANGDVILVGGNNNGVTLSASELYHPVSLSPAGLVSVSITPANRSFLPGTILQLTASGTFSKGAAQKLQSVTWTTSDSTLATITNDSTDHGWAYAVSAGAVTVQACAGAICASTSLTIGPPSVASIAITPVSAAIPAGTPQKFGAVATLSDGTAKDVTSSVTWSSTSTQVAAVSAIGLANGLMPGSTSIQATLGSVTSSAALTVQAPVLINLAVTPSLGGTTVGGTQQFLATGTYTDGRTQDLTQAVTWSSSSTSVATVAAGGLSRGVANGKAAITARLGGATNSASLTVAAASSLPTIAASASPAPNNNGWNHTDVTVTFICSAGSAAITACPSPQIISSEGINQVISGTVTDVSGNSATANITVSIDKSAPALVMTSPSEGDTFTSAQVTATGNVSDVFSGISAVSCNGAPVAVSGGSFSCNVSLTPGVNLIRVRIYLTNQLVWSYYLIHGQRNQRAEDTARSVHPV